MNMFKDLCKFLEHWLVKFEASERSYLTVSIGCTGGQHRSVFIAEMLARHFSENRQCVMVRHREIKSEQ
jgi:UPF0042 nucleotide-binding protein